MNRLFRLEHLIHLLIFPMILFSCSKPAPPVEEPIEAPTPVVMDELSQKMMEIPNLVQSGKADDAIQIIRELLEEYPEQESALRTQLLRIYLTVDRADEALLEVENAIIANPTDAELLAMKAQIYSSMNRQDDAVAQYQSLIEAFPDSPHALQACMQLGNLYLGKGELEEAYHYFRKAADGAPAVGFLQYRLATLARQLGMLEEALEAARQTIELSREDLNAHRLYQDLAVSLGKRAEILEEYQNFVEQYPQNYLFHYLYGRIIEDDEAARAQFHIASQLAPRQFWPQYALGIQHFLEQDYERARERMNNALTSGSSEDRTRSRMYLSLIDMAEGKYDEAISRLQQIIAENPRDIRPFSVLHRAYLEQGKYEQAEESYRLLETMSPSGDAFALIYRIESAVQRGDREQARDLAKQAEDLESLSSENHETIALLLAQAAMEEGRYDAALELLVSASDASRSGLGLAETRFWLAWLQHRNHDDIAARQGMESLAADRSRMTGDTDHFFADAAGFWIGKLTPEAFERQTRLLRYNLINDYWAIRGLKAKDDGNSGAAREYFTRSLTMSRGKDFPARLVEIWVKS